VTELVEVSGTFGGEEAVAVRHPDGRVEVNGPARIALTDLQVDDWVRLPNGLRVQVGNVEGGPLEFVGACILVFDEDPEPTILGADVYDDVQLT
jgi:hypothetical protein